MYWPSEVNRQVIWSGWEDNRICWICVHNSTNCRSAVSLFILLNPLIQQRLVKAFATVIFFRQAHLKHSGAISFGACPFSQRSFQKLVRTPFPIDITVHALNNSSSSAAIEMDIPVQGLDGSAQCNHSHRSLKARLKHVKSFTPRPPKLLALFTLLQLTKQVPFLASSAPFQRKFLRIRSMRLIAHFDKGKEVMWYTGMEDSTEFTKVSRPARFSSLPFQPGSLAPILSMRICSSALLVLPIWSGSPRYLHGNSATLPWKASVRSVWLIPSQRIRYSSDFWMFVMSPVALPKICRRCRTFVISLTVGRTNNAASSAYKLVDVYCVSLYLHEEM